MTDRDSTDLPHEIADWVTKPFARFLKIEAAAGGLLLFAVTIALVVANSAWSQPFLEFWKISVGFHIGSLDVSRSLQHWINDGLMTLFFFVISLELKREIVLGELRHIRSAALPFAAALGGMIVPVSVYLVLMAGQAGIHGWGTVMATDTAFVIGCLALFGTRIPAALRLFLLSLAIFDDVGAILVVAVGYGEALNWPALGFGIIGLGVVYGLASLGIRNVTVYFGLGALVWLCFDASGIHATIAGVILGLMTPTRIWLSDTRMRLILGRLLAQPADRSIDASSRQDFRQAGRAVKESVSPLERLEMSIHPWVSFVVMPLFALANAGVGITVANIGGPVAIAISISLALGKPVGVFCFSWLAVRVGLAHRDSSLSWPVLGAGALLTGIGFTMSLFIAELAYTPLMLAGAKIGILIGSLLSATTGLLMLVWVVRRKGGDQGLA